MAEPRENSVLFSLKELRQIEDQRVKQEEEAEQARAEAERKAQEDAVRQAAEAAERKVREEQDRLHRMKEDKERQLREEQMRLEAEKHRVEVDSQRKLEEARLQAAAHATAAAKKSAPLGLILGSGGVLVVLAGVLAYVLLVVVPQRDKAAQEAAERQVSAIRAQFKEQQEVYEKQQQALRDQLARTTDAAEKAKLEAQLAANDAAVRAAREQATEAVKKVAAHPSAKKGRSERPGQPKLNCDPDKDPLCGSGL